MIFGLHVRVPFRLRIFFRGVFALLALATLALALNVLVNEKQRALRAYAETLQRNLAQAGARLRHPTGQLMLLNPGNAGRPGTPLVLPFGALDFDDRTKAQQALEVAGCGWQYASGGTFCAAVGSNPYAGGFLYLVGSFTSRELVQHRSGELDFATAHRVAIELTGGSEPWRWVAPYAAGRLTGFAAGEPITPTSRPVRDFRGWLWQEARCVPGEPEGDDCRRRSFFSVRLPVEVFRDALTKKPIAWPPPELPLLTARVQVLPPGDGPAVFDSAEPDAVLPFGLADLQALLRPGETLAVRRGGQPVLELKGAADGGETIAPWVAALIRRLRVEGDDQPLQAHETIATPLGRFELTLAGDIRAVNRQLAAVATRISGFVGAMLGAVLLAWLALELRIIRRVTLLTRRAALVSQEVKAGAALPELNVRELRGSDELGVLAQGLQDLLLRVNDDLRREQIRAEQEKNLWLAVGHEIMSPLQSLMALHGTPGDPAERYISRMQQAVRVLYGQASPSEAFDQATLQVAPIDLEAFFGHVAGNAAYIGIDDVRLQPFGKPLMARADEYPLEDVVTHVLRNAARHRTPGTPITITLAADGGAARAVIHNHGEPIDDAMLDRIFEYGVSSEGTRGQGLFVARTYMAKMGGTITAANVADGVVFTLSLPRAA